MSTITSANAKLTIAVRSLAGIVVGPFTVKGFATDDAFAVDAVQGAVARMGVDGIMSVGFTPFPTPQTIILQPDSPSIQLFDDWMNAQIALRDALVAEGSLVLPGTGRAYVMNKGALTRYTTLPPAKAVLEPVQYEITWESVVPAPLAL